MKCRICGKELQLSEVVNDCRDDGGGALIRPYKWNLKYSDIEIFNCDLCNLLQSENTLESDIYEKYEDCYGASQYYGMLCNRDRYIKKLASYSSCNSTILELGCGVGCDLEAASKYFKNVEGIDPSKEEVGVAVEKGLYIYEGYFDEQFAVGRNENYDAIMSFQVLEHIEDIMSFLKNAYDILKIGGSGLINVPNGQEIFRRGLFHQVITQHINYWSPYSLAYAIKQAGFEIIEIEQLQDEIELNIYFRKPGCVKKLNAIKSELEDEFKTLNRYSRIGIWGGGAKSHIYLNMLDKRCIKNIFDSDSSKWGKYISGFDKAIEKPTELTIADLDAIVIFATSYANEIELGLRQLGFEKDIYTISKQEKLIRL